MSEYKYIDSNNIKKVLFILENCDSITVPIENFSFIELNDGSFFKNVQIRLFLMFML